MLKYTVKKMKWRENKEGKFMNIQRFKNNDIRKLICETLVKTENEPIYVEELVKIERLTINPRLFKVPTLQVDLSDLVLLKNLKKLYIRDLHISDFEVDCINHLTSFEYLQINDSKILKLHIPFYLEKLNGFTIVTTKGVNLKDFNKLYNLKILKVISCEVEKYKGISDLKNLEEIYLQGLDVVDLKTLLKINNLKLVNLDGSTVKKDKYEMVLKERVKVEHAKEFFVV